MTSYQEQRRPRVAWVAVEPTPYHMPLFARLRDEGRIDIKFFFCGQQIDQPWMLDKYASLIAPESLGRAYRLGRHFLNPAILRAIHASVWDAVVFSGYAHFTMQLGILDCLARQIPFLLQSDTHLLPYRSVVKRVLKRAILFPFLRRAAAGLGWGKLQADYFRSIGIPTERIFSMPLTPHLPQLADRAGRIARDEARRAAGVPTEAVVGIYVGRLAPVKGVGLALEGVALLDPARRPHLLIVGDGPQRAELERLAAENRLDVTFAGFQQNEDLGRFYRAADFFFLPSNYEPWGVVVAEAMACGLPAVLSRQVGAGYDLLQDGTNGCLVTRQDPQSWGAAFDWCVTNQKRLPILGEEARRATGVLACENSAAEFYRALDVALGASWGHLGRGEIGLEDSPSSASEL